MFKVSIWVLASQSVTVLQPAEKSCMPQPCMLVLLWDVVSLSMENNKQKLHACGITACNEDVFQNAQF